MDNPEQPTTRGSSTISHEAFTGAGITVASLGVLFLLLGWAQWMRLERENSVVWLVLAAVFVVAGVVTAMIGQSRKRR